MNILHAIHDTKIFGEHFRQSESWLVWEVFLCALFALPLTGPNWPRGVNQIAISPVPVFRKTASEKPSPSKSPVAAIFQSLPGLTGST